MEWGAIAGTAAALIGSLINMGLNIEAQNVRQRIADQFGPEILPDLDRIVAQQIDKTAQADIKEDPQLRARQLQAVNALFDTYEQGGNTAADQAAMQLANDTVSRAAAGRQQAMANSLAERGIGNSPLAAALGQSNAQQQYAQLGTMARQNQVDARQRALQALISGAGMAGNVRDADYQRAANLAAAQDELNRFNASARERAALANNQIALSEYDANMQRLAARSNALAGVASGYQNLGQMAANMGGGIGQAALTWGTMKKKENP